MTNLTPSPDRRALMHDALQAIDDLQSKLDRATRAAREPIAIVGMSCRFPGGANSPEAYWELLREGRDAVSEYPLDRRAKAEAAGVDLRMLGDDRTWYGGFLDQIDQFDAAFFGISPREAATMDPQQRMALEVSWEALERAGIAPDSLDGTATGVFLGITTNEYVQLAKLGGPASLDVYSATGGALNAAAGRVAYTLGLQGPCLAIDTACSSSLVALHEACQSLRLGESDLALAGGVNLVLLPEAFVCFERWGMMAPDGRCKTFDAAADGFVRGEGCGMLVLKRLSDAIADGDPILATIRGSAVNQDGRSSGLTVPNGLAQQAVIRRALAAAEIQPREVQYFEAHGTGTTLGDPIEVEAMGAALGAGRSGDQVLYLGSVKTNLGHLESAAGIAGVIKVVLSMQHGAIPAHLHLHERSPHIPWPDFAVTIPTSLTDWVGDGGRRVAGVSGFGFSGTNAHVVLESAPIDDPAPDATGPQLLVLSAKNERALRELAVAHASNLATDDAPELWEVCAVHNGGRAAFAHRLALVAETRSDMRAQLLAFASGEEAAEGTHGRAARPRTAMLFTGQGSQYAGMARELYDAQPVFRAALDTCAQLLADELAEPLLDVLFAEPSSRLARLLDETAYTQPALFAVELALAELWRSWGLVPHAMFGHSVGEYVAATVAGVFSLQDGLRLIAARGRLMQKLPEGGAMAAVFAPAADVAAVIEAHPDDLAIAAINGPAHTVVSGRGAAVDAVVAEFAGRGCRIQRLVVSHAFHSPLMAPMLADFAAVANTVVFHAPRATVISGVTGDVADASIATPAYWVRHVQAPVRFASAMASMQQMGIDTFVEVGPHPVLLAMGRSCVPPEYGTWIPSLRRKHCDQREVLQGVGALFVAGARINWPALRPPARRRTAQPTAPFQRERHWLEPAPRAVRRAATDSHPLLGAGVPVPALRATVFESEVASHAPAWLNDHRLAGTVVFPGSAYMEMALAAVDDGRRVVESLVIDEPLVLADDAVATMQTIVVDERDGTTRVQITTVESLHGTESSATVHAHAVTRRDDAPVPATVDLEALDRSFPDALDVAAYYQRLGEIGLSYGPAFQGLARLARRDGAAIGLVALPGTVADRAGYHLHPALLDACFHVLGVALARPDDASDDMLVPVAMRGLRLHRSGATSAWCVATILDGDTSSATVAVQLDLYDLDGHAVATVERLEVRRTPRSLWQRLSRAADALPMYDIAWRPQARPRSSTAPRTWIVLADATGVADELAEALRTSGSTCITVAPDDQGAVHAQVLDVIAHEPGPFGVVHLCGLDGPEHATTLAELRASETHTSRSALDLAQLLAAQPALDARLFMVTRGAQSVEGEPPSPHQAMLWGLARVIANEQPGLQVTSIDLDPARPADAMHELVAELHAGGVADQIAHRGSRRLVARLARPDLDVRRLPLEYQLELARRGSLEDLAFAPLERRSPGPHEVSVEVRATGINFRDVLNVLGMYPGDPGAPGLECSGVVVAVGASVTDLAVGDAVVGIAPRAFDSHVVTDAALLVKKPHSLSFAEAATLPIAYLTAAYGFHHLAHLRPGERVLIHAAAGGVGTAAVHLAHRIGAEVYATVGSAEKRRALEALGVRHIYNSRTLDFAAELMEDTAGAGVDVVLNSLSDDFISRSFSVLAPGGRFLEIGKRGIWSVTEAAAARPDVSYHPYDLADFLADDPADVHRSLQAVVDDVASGRAAPLRLRAFPAEAIDAAFRFVAQARHIGKVVVTHRPSGGSIRADGAYLVTGGLGGLGLAVAGWLAEQGARHLVLVGRRPPTAAAGAAVGALARAGVRVDVVQADVARPTDVDRLMGSLREEDVALRGIFHTAGVLDDGALALQTWARFEGVLAPKVTGAWLLDQATRTLDLDHFVLFSSASAVLGAPGQSSYAAANSFMDALAQRRRAAGTAGLSINWGAWREIGMAAGLGAREQAKIAERGIGSLDPAEALAALDASLRGTTAQVVVLPVDRTVLSRQTSPQERLPILDELLDGAAGAHPQVLLPTRTLHDSLTDVAPGERRDVVRAYVSDQLVRVLGLDASAAIDPTVGLTELGLDSLMAVELSNRLAAGTGLTLRATLAFEQPTLGELSDHLSDELGLERPASAPPAASTVGVSASITRVPRDRPLVVSPAQRRLLFIDQLQPGAATYNIPAALRLTGHLVVDAIEKALSEIVRRHEALRTNFDVSGEEYTQIIGEPAPLPVRRVDVRTVPAEQREDALWTELHAEAARGFDLRSGSKIRATLMQLGEQEHVLLLVVHHIAIDGWSMARLYDELVELYDATLRGTDAALPELHLQYADYAAWQNAQAGSDLHREQLAYWTDHLRGSLPILEMPTDRPRPPVRSYGGSSVRSTLSPELMARVTTAARACGVTPFVFLMAGYVATLARWTSQDDIVVGTATANRARPETTNIIGLFANTLALRMHVDTSLPFTTLLEEVRRSALGAFAHQDVPFDSVVEAVQPARDLTRSALFQTTFIYTNVPTSSVAISGLSASPVDLSPGATEQDLAFSVTEAPDRTVAEIQFNTDVFEADTVERLLDHWTVLLQAATSDPTTSVGALPMLSAQERLVLEQWARHGNDVLADVPFEAQRIERQVAMRAASMPQAVAVVAADGSLTYRELEERSNQLARHLRELGVGPGDRVGVAVERSAHMVTALLGVLKAGAAYVPLDPSFPVDRLTFMIDDAAVRVILVSDGSLADRLQLPGLVTLDVVGDAAAISARDSSPVDPVGTPTDAAYVFFTSGSTGRPKGVEVEHRSVVNFLLAMLIEPGLGPDDVVLAVTTMSFDPSVLDIFVPLLAGARIIIATRDDMVDGRRLAALIESSGATLMQATPTTWSMLLESGWSGRDGLTILCGGEAMSPDLARRLLDRSGAVWNVFGPTETTVWSTVFKVDESGFGRGTIPIGRPIANQVVRVVDGSGALVPVGVPGELLIGGVGVARGYLERPELTAERFIEDPFEPGERVYRTGDVARWRADGNLEYVGRSDFQVKIRGHRIELGEIDAALRSYEGVSNAVVIADGEASAARLLAYVLVSEHAAAPSVPQLRGWLQARLPEYMVPSRFVTMDEFPLTPSRKIDRNALPRPERSIDDAMVDDVAPRDELETALAEIWQHVLGVERVGVNRNFFELGGHSLLATRVVSRVHAELGVDLSVRAMFEAPTVEQLALAIRSTTGSGSGAVERPAAIQRVDRSAPLALSFAQERMWFLDRLVPDAAVYKIPVAVRLSGPLDVDALARAVDALVARHEALRTRLVTDERGQPWAEIDPPPSSVLEVIGRDGAAHGGPVAEGLAPVLSSIHEMVHARVDLATGPVFQARLFVLGETDHVLAMVIHHAMADQWSIGVLGHELTGMYNSLVQGDAVALEELAVQYVDFAAWQRTQLQGHALERQLDYWRERLAGMSPLDLPLDHPRPAMETYRGRTVHWPISADLIAAVEALGRRHGVSLFATMLASFQLLLGRYSGQSDIPVGVPVAHRRGVDIERIVGNFVNTLVIRTDLAERPTFAELMRRVQRTLFDATAHQDLPFEALVAELARVRDFSRAPLVQVLFNIHQPAFIADALRDLDVEPLPVERDSAQFDLSVLVATGHHDGDPQVVVEFNVDLFDATTIERMIEHWAVLLAAAVDDADSPAATLPMLGEAEQRLVSNDWAISDFDATRGVPEDELRVHRLVSASASTWPTQVAVADAAGSLTHAQLEERSNRLARHLVAVGVRRGDRVGVAVERSCSMLVSLLGVMKAGAAYVPLDLGFPAERLAFMVADAGVQVVLVSGPELSEMIDLAGVAVVDVVDAWPTIDSLDPSPVESVASADDVAYVIYTSGSTGTPKGVEIEHRSVCNFLLSMQRAPGCDRSDLLLAVTTLSFDISVLELFLPLTVGASLFIASREDAMDARRLAKLIDASGATVMQATPTTWSMLFDSGWTGAAGLRVLCGGEAMPAELGARLLAGCREVWNMFGPTETTIWSTIQRLDTTIVAPGVSVPIGRPIANTVVRVLDPSGEPTPIGVPGELHIGGAGVARGYLGRSELTAARFVDDPFQPGGRLYRTGDVVRWRPDGLLEYVSRADDQVKVRGFRIELGEIESALRGLSSIRDAVVTVDGGGATARLLAYLIPADPAAGLPPVAELRAALQLRLPDYMVPARYIPIESIPTTPNRKIDRKALPAPDAAAVVGNEYVEPADDVERVVAGTIADTLGVERVGALDNFFDLGGQSLHAMSLVARLAETFGVDLPLRAFFVDPTARNVAAVLREDPEEGARVERIAAVRARLAAMSPEEVAAMLAARRPASGTG